MLGNGLSSSPSNTPPPLDRAAFPNVTLYDNVVWQHRLVTQHLRIKLVVGYSMGAQQAFQWGALYSDIVQAIAALCGSARTSPHNYLFLDGVKAALLADAAFADGWYQSPPIKGLRAFSRVYSGWLASQDFFREQEYRKMGLASLEDAVLFFEDISGGVTRMICWRCCGRGSMLTSARTLSIGAILLLRLEPSALARS
jgi:homoserine O-acetyltransferase